MFPSEGADCRFEQFSFRLVRSCAVYYELPVNHTVKAFGLLSDQDRERLDQRGYCILSDIPLDNLLPIATHLGSALPDPRDQKLVKDIRPQPAATANPNTLSSRYGKAAFPLHTEAAFLPTPPRFLLLYCVHPGSGGRPTTLLDGRKLFGRIRNIARSGTWLVKRRSRAFLCEAVVGTTPEDFRVRYDPACLFPRGPKARAEKELIETFISESRLTTVNWLERQLLIVDNLRMLHGRGESNFNDQDRWLKRVLVA
jgi:alpha-ketoglutarate-dependent taurine dioxygenase